MNKILTQNLLQIGPNPVDIGRVRGPDGAQAEVHPLDNGLNLHHPASGLRRHQPLRIAERVMIG